MLDKLKGLGNQISSFATDAVDGVSSTVKVGAESIADAASAAAQTLNETAVRTAVDQMRRILEIAAEEIRQRPVLDRPVTLTAIVNIRFTALEMQVIVSPERSESKPEPQR